MNETRGSAVVEKTALRIGVMPLADAAPLVVAAVHGYFEQAGLAVDLVVEKSWAAIRDKVAIELLDAAQMPAPMPLAATLGIDSMCVPMLTALSLGLNGNGITVSAALHARMRAATGPSAQPADAAGWARALRKVIHADRSARPVRLVCVHAFSKHHYELRQWLAAGGIDADREVRLGVMPPARMVAALAAGEIDGFCSGAPWSEVARQQGCGVTVATSWQLWNNGPEKVLGVTRDWAEQHPRTHAALIAALLQAARWLDASPDHRAEAARLLLERGVVAAPSEALVAALAFDPERSVLQAGGYVFHAGAASFPWRSHGRWFVEQMQACGQLRGEVDVDAVVDKTYRCDLFRTVAETLAERVPAADHKTEDTHAEPWEMPTPRGLLTMGPDLQPILRRVDG